MKNLITVSIALCFMIFKTYAQSYTVTPDVVNGEYCPGVDYTFKVSGLPASNFTIEVSSNLNSPIIVSAVPQLPNPNIPFTFVGKFRDVRDKQSFRVTYYSGNDPQPIYYDGISIFKIKSLSQANPPACSLISPNIQSPIIMILAR